MTRPRLLALPDKFRGTATATEVAEAIAAAGRAAGWDAEAQPVADGGEGLLACFGGANRSTTVRGPLGDQLPAGWRIDGNRAVLEMAAAAGLALTAGANDPIRASTRGVGQLVAAAVRAGAREIVVGAGGSASTDGGAGAVEALRELAPLDGSRGYTVEVAVDVTTAFLAAARVFGPQKGAGPGQVDVLETRLGELARRYIEEFGVDVTALPGAGAAGGLAGGLAALGARIRPGFDLVAAQLDLAARIGAADLVITGEGRLDRSSFAGKAPTGVLGLARRQHTAAALIVGSVARGVESPVPIVSLTAAFGRKAALGRTLDCVAAATTDLVAAHPHPPGSQRILRPGRGASSTRPTRME